MSIAFTVLLCEGNGWGFGCWEGKREKGEAVVVKRDEVSACLLC